MVSKNYTILQRVAPPEKCYLFEVLLWRAFGRFPIEFFALGGEDWRFESDVRDGFDAPFPDGGELTEDECNFAGIPADPRMTALLHDEPSLSPDHYDDLLVLLSDSENICEPAWNIDPLAGVIGVQY